MFRKYLPIITFLVGSLVSGVLTGVTMGSTALANIKENKADILECKQGIDKCRDTHQELLIAINGVSEKVASREQIELMMNKLLRQLGHEHTIPELK